MTKRVLASLLVISLLCPLPTFAQQPQPAGVVTVLEGDVTARRQPQTVALKFKDNVFVQDTVVTQEKSLARMLLGGRAVVTVRERSSVTINRVPPTEIITADAGSKFGLAVARERMGQDRMEIRTPNAIAGVRGTVVITDVSAPRGGGAVTTDFYVLRGSITVQQLNPPGPPVTVNTLQRASISGSNPPSTAPIPPEQVGAIVAGLQPASLRGGENLAQDIIKPQALSNAVALVSVLNQGPEALQAPVVPASTTVLPTNPTLAPVTPLTNETPTELISTTTSACPGCVRVSGASLSVVGTPFQSFSGSVASSSPLELLGFESSVVGHSGSNSFLDVTSGSTLALTGPLVNLIDSTITTTGAFLEINNGQITSLAPLITLDPSHIIADDTIVILRGGALNLSDSLLVLLDSTVTSDAHGLDVFNGGVVTKTGPAPLIDLVGSVPGGAQMSIFESMISLEATPTVRNVMTLEGSLFRSVNATVTVGNALDILEGAILTKAPSTDTSPLFDMTATTFVSDDALVNVWFSPSSATPSTLVLGDAPLLKATNSTLSFANNILYVETGVFSSTGTGALVDLTNSVVDVGFGGLLGAFEFIIGSSVSLNGPLLAMNGGQLSTGAELLFMSGSTLSSSGAGALFQLTNGASASVALGLADIGDGSTLSLAGPLLSLSGGSQLTTSWGLVAVNGSIVNSTTTQPLMLVDNSTLSSSVALLQADGTGFTSPKITLKGPILSATNGSTVSVTDSFFELISAFETGVIDIANQAGPLVAFSGGSNLVAPRLIYANTDGAIVTNGSTGPFFSFTGGTHTIGVGQSALQLDGFNLDFPGEVVPEIDNGDGFDNNVNFQAASDQPLQHAGPIVDADAATITTSSGLLLDKALLQASAPLFNLKNGSLMNVSGNAVDMVNQAKLVALIGPLIKLDASTMNIAGHAFNVTNGSFLKVTSGDLASIANGSILNVGGNFLNVINGSLVQVNNGTLLNINNSAVTINGALVNWGFSGQSTVAVSNGLPPSACVTCGGLPIHFTGGAGPGNVSVSGLPLQGNFSGFGGTAGSGTGSVIVINGASSSLTINGN
jgi:hypothetical protein